jgi:carboxymethylenebutenolidase
MFVNDGAAGSQDLGGAMIEIPTISGSMKAYETARPESPDGGMVLLHDGFGIGPTIEAMCEIFADRGWHVVCPQLFHRSGHLTIDHTADLSILGTALESDEHILADIDASSAYLAAQGYAPAEISVVGFCWGGRGAFLAALNRDFASTVSFYGTGIAEPLALPGVEFVHPQVALLPEADRMRSPWHGAFGGSDMFIPIQDVQLVAEVLDREATTRHEIAVYDDQPHGFVHHGVLKAADMSEVARQAWERAVEFLTSTV